MAPRPENASPMTRRVPRFTCVVTPAMHLSSRALFAATLKHREDAAHPQGQLGTCLKNQGK